MHISVAENPKPIIMFEAISRRTKLPYPLFWTFLCAVLAGCGIYSFRDCQDRILGIWLPVFMMAASAHLPISMIYSSDRIWELLSSLGDICQEPDRSKANLMPILRSSYSSRNLVTWGLIFVVVLELVVGISSGWYSEPQVWFTSTAAMVWFIALWGITSFITGCGAWAIYKTMFITIKLSSEPLRLSLHAHKGRGVHRVGKLYLKFSYLIAVAAVLGVAGVLSSPVAFYPLIVAMGLFFLSTPFTYFIVTQWKLHCALAGDKARLLDEISTALETSIRRIGSISQTEPMFESRTTQLFELRREVQSLPEWSFDITAILKVAASSFGPILIYLFQYWDKISKYVVSLAR